MTDVFHWFWVSVQTKNSPEGDRLKRPPFLGDIVMGLQSRKGNGAKDEFTEIFPLHGFNEIIMIFIEFIQAPIRSDPTAGEGFRNWTG